MKIFSWSIHDSRHRNRKTIITTEVLSLLSVEKIIHHFHLISFMGLNRRTETNNNYCKLKKKASALRPLGLLFFDVLWTSTRPNCESGLESRNLWFLFAKSCWNINTGKMLRMLFSLMCIKYVFFRFYRSVRFEENIKYTKNWWYAAFTFASNLVLGAHVTLVLRNGKTKTSGIIYFFCGLLPSKIVLLML